MKSPSSSQHTPTRTQHAKCQFFGSLGSLGFRDSCHKVSQKSPSEQVDTCVAGRLHVGESSSARLLIRSHPPDRWSHEVLVYTSQRGTHEAMFRVAAALVVTVLAATQVAGLLMLSS